VSNQSDEELIAEAEAGPKPVVLIQQIEYYERAYAKSCEGNDQKAVQTFKMFESAEKLRRLQHDLILIKDDKVKKNLLDAVVGRKREARHGGYKKWAELMLLWIAAARK
jgi:hypothetical protein